MAKTWYKVIRNRTFKVTHVMKMRGYQPVASAQLFTDVVYTHEQMKEMCERPEAQDENLGRWYTGMAAAYEELETFE